jgi:hypothetical protein
MAATSPPPAWAIVGPPPPPPPRMPETSLTSSPAPTLRETSGCRFATKTALSPKAAAKTTADGPERRFFTSSEIWRSPLTSAATTCPVTTFVPSICSAFSTREATSSSPFLRACSLAASWASRTSSCSPSTASGSCSTRTRNSLATSSAFSVAPMR